MIFSTCNQYSIKGIFLILLLMISTTFIQAQKADLSFSIHLNLKSATPFPKCYLHKEEWTFDS